MHLFVCFVYKKVEYVQWINKSNSIIHDEIYQVTEIKFML